MSTKAGTYDTHSQKYHVVYTYSARNNKLEGAAATLLSPEVVVKCFCETATIIFLKDKIYPY